MCVRENDPIRLDLWNRDIISCKSTGLLRLNQYCCSQISTPAQYILELPAFSDAPVQNNVISHSSHSLYIPSIFLYVTKTQCSIKVPVDGPFPPCRQIPLQQKFKLFTLVIRYQSVEMHFNHCCCFSRNWIGTFLGVPSLAVSFFDGNLWNSIFTNNVMV